MESDTSAMLVLVLTFLGLATNTWTQWREKQVVTTLRNTNTETAM